VLLVAEPADQHPDRVWSDVPQNSALGWLCIHHLGLLCRFDHSPDVKVAIWTADLLHLRDFYRDIVHIRLLWPSLQTKQDHARYLPLGVRPGGILRILWSASGDGERDSAYRLSSIATGSVVHGAGWFALLLRHAVCPR